MISVTEAKAILKQQTFQRKTARIPLPGAAGLVLAEDVYAKTDIPGFDQSSMDGYAFGFAGWQPGQSLRVTGKLPAGHPGGLTLAPGEAARIFTGAPLPEGADTVVMQEQTTAAGSVLDIQQTGLQRGDNMRPRGTDIRNGDLALEKGTMIGPGAAGFLASTGCDEVTVYIPPKIAVVITGDELQQPGAPLSFGQVYEASSTMLRIALAEMGLTDITLLYTRDDADATTDTLNAALQAADVVLLTGGVSVGEYDFVVQAAGRCGVQQLFHRIKQRPGKPLYAGRKNNQPVFGLPGNPSSVLTCFYEYVWPLLRHLTGHNDTLKTLTVPLAVAHHKPHQLTHFLKGNYENGRVTILTGQESYRMRSFATANCLVVLDEPMRLYEENELVDIHLVPVYE